MNSTKTKAHKLIVDSQPQSMPVSQSLRGAAHHIITIEAITTPQNFHQTAITATGHCKFGRPRPTGDLVSAANNLRHNHSER